MKLRRIALLLALSLLLSGCAAPPLEPTGSGETTRATVVPSAAESLPAATASGETTAPETGAPTSEPPTQGTAPSSPTVAPAASEPTGSAPTASTAPEETAPPTPSAPSAPAKGLHVEGTRLVDGKGNPVQLRGISTHGLAWYPEYVNKDCFRQLSQEWQVNVIRLAMYTGESGGYCTGGDQAALKRLVRKGIEYATELGMYGIIDWHILSDGDPNQHLSQAKAFFQEMSQEFADQDNVLYEICNEPNGGTTWAQIKAYALQVIPVIRKNDPDAVIIVGTPNWSQAVDQAAADPIREYDNLVYALHFYAATHKEDLREKMIRAVKAGLPVFVSEYGICDASGSGSIDETQADRWIAALDQYGISYVAWNLSNKAETSALLKSSCRKTSGFTGEDLSASGRWLYRTLTGRQPSSGSGESTPTQPPAPTAPPAPTIPSEPPASGGTLENGGLEITATLRSSWEEGGQPVYLYDLTLKNISGTPCSAWRIRLTFQGEITLLQGWNGQYTPGTNSLEIASLDYNGKLDPGGTLSDVGFIVKGAALKND